MKTHSSPSTEGGAEVGMVIREADIISKHR